MGGHHLQATETGSTIAAAVTRQEPVLAWPLSVAPMMDRTDRHFRAFMRRITGETLLYTEMVTTGAVLHGDRERILGFSVEERPLALQLGGDDPAALAECAALGEALGFDEVNLNVGCPSDRVQKGRFGVCLMKEPRRVAAATAAMLAAVRIPVTVKHRIGVDHLDRFEDLARFVAIVAETGVERFTVHARKAWLRGLSPKENRTVPPLRYHEVYRLKERFPRLTIEINGGIRSLDAAAEHLNHVDGVMIGRAAYEDPFLFATADQAFYGRSGLPPSRHEVIEGMIPYTERWLSQGVYLSRISRHLLTLFNGRPGARGWRRTLSEKAHLPGAGVEVIREALAGVPEGVLDERPEVGVKQGGRHGKAVARVGGK